jgi:hypothetical protein
MAKVAGFDTHLFQISWKSQAISTEPNPGHSHTIEVIFM